MIARPLCPANGDNYPLGNATCPGCAQPLARDGHARPYCATPSCLVFTNVVPFRLVERPCDTEETT